MKDSYPIDNFWSDEGEAFIADLPDLHFCPAWEHAPEEALRELLIAREAWPAAGHGKVTSLPDPRESRYLPETASEALRAEATT